MGSRKETQLWKGWAGWAVRGSAFPRSTAGMDGMGGEGSRDRARPCSAEASFLLLFSHSLLLNNASDAWDGP